MVHSHEVLPNWLCVLQGLARLEELVRKVVDLVDNRVESNLRAIANTMLVDLPNDKSFTYDEFISSQAKFQLQQVSVVIRSPDLPCAQSQPQPYTARLASRAPSLHVCQSCVD